MEQRQPRLGDILDDYCPRERRLTNHAVVAMVGAEVKQTRCTTCEAEHEYKHAKVPRQRRKAESPAVLYAQVAATAPKRAPASHESGEQEAASSTLDEDSQESTSVLAPGTPQESGETSSPLDVADVARDDDSADQTEEGGGDRDDEEGPVHRPLIRASLPREGQPPPVRPIPEFTIRQPGGGRPGRFRPRPQHTHGHEFQGNRSNGNSSHPGGSRGGGPRQGGRPPQGSMPSRLARRRGPGRKRSK